MRTRMELYYGPPSDGAGSPAPGVDLVRDTLPTENDVIVDPWADVEIEDEGAVVVPPELAGKSQAELIAEIERRDRAAVEMQGKVDPAKTLSDTMLAFMQTQKPAAVAPVDGYKVRQAPAMPADPVAYEKWKKGLAEKFLDDPHGATQEVINREVSPLLLTMAESVAMQSRELVRLDPETRDVYAKFASEIESDVAEIDAMTKLKNPRIYHLAVERARARHFNELVSETTKAQQEAIAGEYLKSLGLDLAAIKAGAGATPRPSVPASSTLARAGGGAAPAGVTQKTKISISPAQRAQAVQWANARGVSLEAAVTHLRERGEI